MLLDAPSPVTLSHSGHFYSCSVFIALAYCDRVAAPSPKLDRARTFLYNCPVSTYLSRRPATRAFTVASARTGTPTE